MQTNFSYGVNDLSLITRLYQKQNKLQKGYRITYQSQNGKEDFIGAKDKEEAEQKRKEIESFGHKVSSIKVLKARVYIKNPQDAPPKVEVKRGKRGGLYYESSVTEDDYLPKIPKKGSVELLSTESSKLMELLNIIGKQLQVEQTQPLSENYINDIIKKNNIKLENQIIILPFDLQDCLGFTIPQKDEIYLPSTSNESINELLNYSFKVFKMAKYTDEELKDINVETKRAGTILHEIGHLKVNKTINIKSLNSVSEMRTKQFEFFHEYVNYINEHYSMNDQDVYRELDEMLAEDYRQLVGGPQASMPNRYFYRSDAKSSPNYKYKEGRLNILRKLGVF